MTRWRRLSRRGFLALAVTAALGSAAALAFLEPLLGLLRRLLGTELDTSTGTGPLAAGERATLLAFGEVLVPSEYAWSAGTATLGEAARAVVGATLDDAASTQPGRRAAFRAATSLLDRESERAHGAPFAARSLDERRALAERLLRPYVGRSALGNLHYLLAPGGRAVRALWLFAAKPLLQGFYASELGWRTVGYPRKRGVCSNLVDYTRPPRLPREGETA